MANRTVVVGIAGGSGTGKTTIAVDLAERHDGVLIQTDVVGHEILGNDREVIAGVMERFGPDVFDESGRIDRRRLGAVVFSDDAARRDLNDLVHPVIRRICGIVVVEAKRDDRSIVVVDGALLLDSDMPFEFDLMIALRCDTDTRFRRIMDKGGWTEDEVRRRLQSQADIEKSFYKADAVVDTDGELNEVQAAVGRIVDPLVKA